MIFSNSLFNDFLNNSSIRSKIIVIYGPTACGKTSLSLEIASNLNSEIISTDSRQIYEGLNIGTGKIYPQDMQGIPHHMINIIPPNQRYTVGEFKTSAENILHQIIGKGKIPILVGGTGLYIDSIIYDFDIPSIPADENLRKQLEQEAKKFGKEFVYQKLCEIDPEYAKELHPNNLNYVIRAIEIKTLSGKSKKDFRTQKNLKYDAFFLTPYDGNRAGLYTTINKRIIEMFEKGLIEEIYDLLKKGYKKTDVGLQTIGYKEGIEYIEGNISLSECIALVQQRNRNYAKKQLTWFRQYDEKFLL